jgi:hypothetical protein
VPQVIERLTTIGDRRRMKSLERQELGHHLAQIRVVLND